MTPTSPVDARSSSKMLVCASFINSSTPTTTCSSLSSAPAPTAPSTTSPKRASTNTTCNHHAPAWKHCACKRGRIFMLSFRGISGGSLRDLLEVTLVLFDNFHFFEQICNNAIPRRSRVVAATCAQPSRNLCKIAATCARVALPCGSRVVALVPEINPSATAHCMTSVAHGLGWSV